MTKIFYFSGTGNSFRIAKKLAEKLHNCDLAGITREPVENIENIDVAGVVFPVYYFGLPEIVENFFVKNKFRKDSFLFIIVTRGVPLSGGVKNQLQNIVDNKISFFRYLTMGDNFVIDFWNASSDRLKKLRNRKSDIEIDKIAFSITNKVVSRKFSLVDYFGFITRNFPRYGYKTYRNKIYNSDAFFNVNTDICIKCKKCFNSCPLKNLRLNNKIQWMHSNCQLCLACYHCCPVNAIQYNNGYLSTTGKKQYWNFILTIHTNIISDNQQYRSSNFQY